MRLYLDEDSQARAIVSALRAAGHDVLTTAEAGKMSAADEDHLRLATELGRVVLTANRHDYARLHHQWMTTGRSHAGIVLRRQGDQIGRLVDAIEALERGLGDRTTVNHLEWLSAPPPT